MAEEKDTSQERSEQPTNKRLDDARKKGQIARSREFNTMVIMALAAVAMIMMGQTMMNDLSEIVKQHLQPTRQDIFDVSSIVRFLYDAIFAGVWLLMPFFIIMMLAALLAPLSIGGWAFSFEALQPKLSKLNPLKGLKRIFSAKGLIEMIKAFAKFVLVAAVAITVIWVQMDEFLQLGYESVDAALAHAGDLFAMAFLLVTSALIVIAAIDVPFQIWDHSKQMKMTKQEVKDEMKDTEGKPEVRSRIRQLQYEAAQARMMEAVPDADVVITNPTHFAVALKYDQKRMIAPMVVARGADLVAANIRRIAKENEVLLVETPPLARALYHSTDIGQQIPEGLYLAVAQVLAYVYQLRTVQKNGGVKPSQPKVKVPDEFQKYADMGKQPDETRH
ncbi:MAG: flagellar biosynthesis protein FlhB [Gammaproteobacteria bacterium]|nr:flagellar biosynthesis protein FlhB [Gammaproteobacteria bacterium]MCW9003936.1 flagellar biosynthesis protein FlhB [Gammaproteobacteria bacterium]MCW9056920.1 flagellar biosynthesis protein FlhB [Gammaproteobacteria bacterium]